MLSHLLDLAHMMTKGGICICGPPTGPDLVNFSFSDPHCKASAPEDCSRVNCSHGYNNNIAPCVTHSGGMHLRCLALLCHPMINLSSGPRDRISYLVQIIFKPTVCVSESCSRTDYDFLNSGSQVHRLGRMHTGNDSGTLQPDANLTV